MDTEKGRIGNSIQFAHELEEIMKTNPELVRLWQSSYGVYKAWFL